MRRHSRAVSVILIAAMSVALSLAGQSSAFASPVAPGEVQSAQTATIAGTVVQNDGKPVAGATVRIAGVAFQQSTTTDSLGTFVFVEVPYGTYSLYVNSVTYGAITRDGVSVNADSNVVIQFGAESSNNPRTLGRVTVSGKGNRINVTPASVYSVSPRDYSFEGNTNWNRLLEQIPGVTLNGGSPGGQGGGNFIPGSPFQPAVISINGALPYETSTTLDGMPLSGQPAQQDSPIDLNQFSPSQFDSADIIRGPGADAPSIVNSIGGSLVLHAPGPLTANHVEASFSNDAWGGLVANMLVQHIFGKASVSFGYDNYSTSGPLGQNARLFTDLGGDAPITINGQPFFGCGGQYPNFGPPFTCNNFPSPGSPLYQKVCGNFFNAYCSNTEISGLMVCCALVNTAWTHNGYSAAVAYKASSAVTAQIFYEGSNAVDRGGNGWDYASLFDPTAPYSGPIPTGDLLTLNSAADGSNSVNHRVGSLLEEKITAFAGKGVWRLAAMQNSNYNHFEAGPNLGPANGVYQLYGSGFMCSDPTCANPGAFVDFNGKPVNLVFGESVFDNGGWSHNHAELLSYGYQFSDTTSGGISYVRSNSDANAFASAFSFLGVNYCNIFVYCGPGPPPPTYQYSQEIRLNAETEVSDKLTADGSVYTTKGIFHIPNPNPSTSPAYVDRSFPYTAPRLGLVWRSNPDTAIRLAAGGGFAEPSFNDASAANSSITCQTGFNFCTENSANLSLRPEESFAIDLGTDLRVEQNTIVSVDAYKTNLWGQFYRKQEEQPCGAICGGKPLFVNEVENLVHTRYDGANIAVNHDVPQGMIWSAALGFMRSYVVSLPSNFYESTPGVPCQPIQNYFGTCTTTNIVAGINFTGGGFAEPGAIPYSNGTGTLGYRWHDGKYLSISPTYFGPNNADYWPAFVMFNANAGIPISRNISWEFAVNNVSNIHGQSNQVLLPVLGAPQGVPGVPPFPTYPEPLGPRTMIVTLTIND